MTTQPTSRMTDAARERVREQLASGADDTNSEFAFSCTNAALLLAIADGLIDPVKAARQELANRGLDADGNWVGFDSAREIHSNDPAADNADAELAVADIARRLLHLDTLETRNSDSLDFHELAAWQIKEALAAAFAAGQAAPK